MEMGSSHNSSGGGGILKPILNCVLYSIFSLERRSPFFFFVSDVLLDAAWVARIFCLIHTDIFFLGVLVWSLLP
jgi:hypothetical protein